jgi:hypothetical protein
MGRDGDTSTEPSRNHHQYTIRSSHVVYISTTAKREEYAAAADAANFLCTALGSRMDLIDFWSSGWAGHELRLVLLRKVSILPKTVRMSTFSIIKMDEFTWLSCFPSSGIFQCVEEHIVWTVACKSYKKGLGFSFVGHLKPTLMSYV